MAQGNIQTRGTLGDLGKKGLGPKFEDVFDQNLIKYEGRENVRRIISFIPTDKSRVRTTGLTGYGFLTEFEEGSPIPQTENIKTFDTVYDIRDYGGRVIVTDDLLEDKEEGLQDKLDEFAGLARLADITPHKHAMQIFNSAFNTTAKVEGVSIHRYNDEALGSTSHARADGGTAQSNRSATDILLTELNLETQRLALVKQLTDNGMPIIDQGRITLVVPDDLEKNATIFTGSTLRPSTANNDLNFYRGIQMDVIASRWLNSDSGGSATAWFLVTQLMTKGGLTSPLRVYTRGAPRFKQTTDGNTWNESFSVKNRYAVGFSEWKGVQVSDGTND